MRLGVVENAVCSMRMLVYYGSQVDVVTHVTMNTKPSVVEDGRKKTCEMHEQRSSNVFM